MELIGKIIEECPIQEGTSRSGNPWKKRMYIVETQESYPKKVALTVFGSDRVAATEAAVKLGDTVRVSFDLESREYNGRWYTDAMAWRIELAAAQPAAPAPQQAYSQPQTYGEGAPVPPPPAAPAAANSEDDLPF
ncbi:MAG: DUF3127 domain-containing protein [Bacteroidales bacterium]|nr:DUF3127 domain-containing protein [Bacteroidales bacterium]